MRIGAVFGTNGEITTRTPYRLSDSWRPRDMGQLLLPLLLLALTHVPSCSPLPAAAAAARARAAPTGSSGPFARNVTHFHRRRNQQVHGSLAQRMLLAATAPAAVTPSGLTCHQDAEGVAHQLDAGNPVNGKPHWSTADQRSHIYWAPDLGARPPLSRSQPRLPSPAPVRPSALSANLPVAVQVGYGSSTPTPTRRGGR